MLNFFSMHEILDVGPFTKPPSSSSSASASSTGCLPRQVLRLTHFQEQVGWGNWLVFVCPTTTHLNLSQSGHVIHLLKTNLKNWKRKKTGCWPYYYITFFICHVVAMSSTCYNPLLYGWFNNAFRFLLHITTLTLNSKRHKEMNEKTNDIFRTEFKKLLSPCLCSAKHVWVLQIIAV